MWEPYDLDRREEEACILLAWQATIGCASVNDPAPRQPAVLPPSYKLCDYKSEPICHYHLVLM